MLSLVIPVYKNEENLPRLLTELASLQDRLPAGLEVVFVVDGSPDRSYEILRETLPGSGLRAQLLSLSRNFGSFAAIAAGLSRGNGDQFAVLAADLQEPPDLIAAFADILQRADADIVFGVRATRSDPWLSEVLSSAFWLIYRRFVVPEMPRGGVDVFGCTRAVRDQLLALPESSTNLIALLFWLGFRRKFVPYHRQPRLEGRSAWTVAKKVKYCVDSIFNFTDLPLRVLFGAGVCGSLFALAAGLVIFVCRMLGLIQVPGYTPIVLTIMFFGGLTTAGLGIIGQYLWLALQNTRRRPNYIIDHADSFDEPRADSRTLGHTSRHGMR
jgi:glycosyltransferase involved in cell wall biosynthesis